MTKPRARNLFLIFLAVLTGLVVGKADEPKTTDSTAGHERTASPTPYEVKVLSLGIVEIGNPVLIGVYDPFAQELKNRLDTDAGTVRKNLMLYLNGVAMEGLLPVVLPPQAALGLKTTDPKPALVLQFVLDRDSNNKDNRNAWDSLLSQLQFFPQQLQVGVGLNGEVPHLTLGKDLQFQVRDDALINSVIAVGIFLLAVGMLAVICSGIVREAGPGTPYSLGKTQMAFWGLLVAISFLGVWLIGHRMERIPPQVLTLIGISGATGLGSVLLTKPKETAQPEKPPQGMQGQPPQHPQREQGAQQVQVVQPAQPPKTDPLRWFLETMSRWFTDIISDGTGITFQRLQVVIWTIILGFIFAWSVADTFSMPEFEPTLLILMGISNGLYLGFKIPETPKP